MITDVPVSADQRGSLLRRNRDFAWLWTGESVSAFGSQITLLALPLVAVQVLHASPAQMGLLAALETVPFLLFAVLAGLWVDRSRKRRLLIGAHLAQALFLALVPVLALVGVLQLVHLLAIAFAVGSARVLFQIAYLSYLPQVVDRDDLVDANSKLSASTSVAEIGGPGAGGLLVGLLTAPVAVAADAASFVFSSLTLAKIRRPEPAPHARARLHVAQEIGGGFRETFRNRHLLAFAGEAANYNIAWHAMNAILVLWAVEDLGLSAATLGLVLSVGSLGALVGALLARRTAHRFGVGRAMWVSALLSNVGVLGIPLVAGGDAVVLTCLGAAFFLRGLGMTGTNVHTYAIRQAVTPPALLGRANAAYTVLTHGFIPLGALLGGLLGEAIGLRPALLVAALALFPSWLWLFFSPARRLRGLPTPPAAPAP